MSLKVAGRGGGFLFVSAGEASFASLSRAGSPLGPRAAAGLVLASVLARLLVLAWPLASFVARPLAFPFFVSAGEASFASLSGSGFPLGPLAAAGLGLSALLARLLLLDWPLASSVGRPLPLPVFFAVAS